MSEMTPNILTQKHIRNDYAIIKTGLAENKPTEGNAQVIFYFSTDTGEFSYWNGSSWISSTLS